MSKQNLENNVSSIKEQLLSSHQAIATGIEAREAIKTKQKELITNLNELENLQNNDERSVILLAEQLLNRGILDNEQLTVTIQVKSAELLGKFNEQNRTEVTHSEDGACLVLDPSRSEQCKRLVQEILTRFDDARAERRNQNLHLIKQLGQGVISKEESPKTLFAFPPKECKCPPAAAVELVKEAEPTAQTEQKKPKKTRTKREATAKETGGTETPKKQRGRPKKNQETTSSDSPQQ